MGWRIERRRSSFAQGRKKLQPVFAPFHIGMFQFLEVENLLKLSILSLNCVQNRMDSEDLCLLRRFISILTHLEAHGHWTAMTALIKVEGKGQY